MQLVRGVGFEPTKGYPTAVLRAVHGIAHLSAAP